MEQRNNVYLFDQAAQSTASTDQYAKASKLMMDITERVKRVSTLTFDESPCEVTQIACAVQVSEELAAIDESMRQISDLVRESTAAVEALEFNADHLAQSLTRFKAALVNRASRPMQSDH